MSTTILRDHLVWGMEQCFDEGKGIESNSYLEELKELTPQQAAWTPPGGSPSIWNIVNHTAEWAGTILKRTRGDLEKYTDTWAEPEIVTEEKWHESVEQLKNIHAALIDHLGNIDDAQLAKQVSPKSTGFNWDMAYAGLIVHAGYHTGQIAKLKELQGIKIK